MTKKERDDAFLNGPDISTCQRCGEFQHIWHIFGKGERNDQVVGMVCTRCFWVCGDATVFDVVSCLFEEWALAADKRRRKRRIRRQQRRRIKKIIKKWRAHK